MVAFRDSISSKSFAALLRKREERRNEKKMYAEQKYKNTSEKSSFARESLGNKWKSVRRLESARLEVTHCARKAREQFARDDVFAARLTFRGHAGSSFPRALSRRSSQGEPSARIFHPCAWLFPSGFHNRETNPTPMPAALLLPRRTMNFLSSSLGWLRMSVNCKKFDLPIRGWFNLKFRLNHDVQISWD